MNGQIESRPVTLPRSIGEAGFSLTAALVVVFVLATFAAAAMKLVPVRWAIFASIVVVLLALLIAGMSDIKRYMKISSM